MADNLKQNYNGSMLFGLSVSGWLVILAGLGLRERWVMSDGARVEQSNVMGYINMQQPVSQSATLPEIEKINESLLEIWGKDIVVSNSGLLFYLNEDVVRIPNNWRMNPGYYVPFIVSFCLFKSFHSCWYMKIKNGSHISLLHLDWEEYILLHKNAGPIRQIVNLPGCF